MGRTTKDARDSAAQEENAEIASDQSLSEMLAAALSDVPIGPAHGALSAISTALNELKARAATVDEHLSAQYAPLLERIQSL